MDDSAIICNEVTEFYDKDEDVKAKSKDEAKLNDKETKTIPANFNEKKATCKIHCVYILLAFLLNIIGLFTATSVYCSLIKYQEKSYYFTTQIMIYKKFCISKCIIKMRNKVKVIDIKNPHIRIFQWYYH